MKKYELLLVDADGTVLDFHRAEDRAIYACCAEMDIPLDAEQASVYKRINDDLWRAFERGEVTQPQLKLLRFARFLEQLGLSRDPSAMADAFVRALSRQADVLPGAEAFLREAAARVPVIIVTNGIPEVQRSRFRLSPLMPYVTDFVISGELGFAKPDPRMIERGLSLGGRPAGAALMLGDEPRSDIAAAVAAGVDSCWFNPDGRDNETEHVPTHTVASLSEVLAWL